MLKKIAKSIALISFFWVATTQALPIVQADAFSAGDNKAVLETNTGLVWMDFGVNSHRTFSDVMSSLDTDYAGWRLPTIAEVDHLWTSLMGDLKGWNRWSPVFGGFALIDNNEFGLPITEYDDYLNDIMEVFGFSEEGAAEYSSYEGEDLISTTTYDYRSAFAVFSDAGENGFVVLNLPINSTVGRSSVFTYDGNISLLQDISLQYGTLLVKDSATVSEPTSLMLLIMGLMGLVARNARLRH
nr:Uvs114 [uncultured bacterium]